MKTYLLSALFPSPLLLAPFQNSAAWQPQPLAVPLKGDDCTPLQENEGSFNSMRVGDDLVVLDVAGGTVKTFPGANSSHWLLRDENLWQWQGKVPPRSHVLRRFNPLTGKLLGQWSTKAMHHPAAKSSKSSDFASDFPMADFGFDRKTNHVTLRTYGHTFTFNLISGRVVQHALPYRISDSGEAYIRHEAFPTTIKQRPLWPYSASPTSRQRFKVSLFEVAGYGFITRYVSAIVDNKTGQIAHKFAPNQFSHFVLSRDGSQALLLGSQSWEVYNLTTGRAIRQIPRASSRDILFAQLSPDGGTLYSFWKGRRLFKQRTR